VGCWQKRLVYEGTAYTYHYQEPFWTFDDALGVLVYPDRQTSKYLTLDLETNRTTEIPFECSSRIIRRIRLQDAVLVVEWCEETPYHQLNENEEVHRHFATSYDIRRDSFGPLRVSFRNEWRIHFLGFPLNAKDRYYSCHTSRYYAQYQHLHNRSAWGEDDPLEALIIWDLSSQSTYKPSENSSGKNETLDGSEGPKVIRRFGFADLDFYNIRQRSTPTFAQIELDQSNVYIMTENSAHFRGEEAGNDMRCAYEVVLFAIPFGHGPHFQIRRTDNDLNFREQEFCDEILERAQYIRLHVSHSSS